MAAVKSPLSPSTNISSHFSPYSDSPSSPAAAAFSKRASTESNTFLHPNPLPSPNLPSPSEADPSPIVSSNGTDFDDMTGDHHHVGSPDDGRRNSSERTSIKIQTTDEHGNLQNTQGGEGDPASVIHAPEGYGSFLASPDGIGRMTPTPSQRSDATIISPSDEEAVKISSPAPPAISTAVPSIHDPFVTPKAQTIQEAQRIENERAAKVRGNNLEDIPELQDDDDEATQSGHDTSRIRSPQQVATLRTALSECWTLCNTLSGLSHLHRERAFRHQKKRDGREQAWKSCWQLCQRLYNTWSNDESAPVAPTLDLCRDFCQSLFEVRQRTDDLADSVLRVSFELNNHLYHTHDRALPDQFRERTLDFYITLCHRLMKQRNQMVEETDNLLRSCWALAEMLFNLRQSKREGKSADEELLGSTIQACWELCDIFREGWTQIRPDRGTPRPSQPPYLQSFHQSKASESAITIHLPENEESYRLNAETPTSTIFEEDKMSPQSPADEFIPNILVLGPDSGDTYDSDWSSSASSYSEYSKQSENTRQSETTGSSTNTVRNAPEDPRLACLRLLFVKASMNLGYDTSTPLAKFVKSLPTNSFGNTEAQKFLLVKYKGTVASDPTFRDPSPHQRALISDIAKSVRWLASSGQQYLWVKDLFRWALGNRVDEADVKTNIFISTV